MEWNITSRGKIKYIVNLLVSVIALPVKDYQKAQKMFYVGNNISLKQSTTNVNY